MSYQDDVKEPLRSRDRLEPTSDVNELHARLASDPRFNPPTPSVWKRIALLVTILLLGYFGYKLRKPLFMPSEAAETAQVTYAQRSASI